MTIGSRISGLRKERNISQELLAEKMGVSRQAVSKWENDQTAPDTNNLIALAEYFGVSVEYLATGNVLPVRRTLPKIKTAGLYMIAGILLVIALLISIVCAYAGIYEPVPLFFGPYLIPFGFGGYSSIGIIFTVIECLVIFAAIILAVVAAFLDKVNKHR